MAYAKKIGQGPAEHPANTTDANAAESGPPRVYAPGRPHEVESGPARLHASAGVQHAQQVRLTGSVQARSGAGLNAAEGGPARIERYRG
jgi:hypothetical protein